MWRPGEVEVNVEQRGGECGNGRMWTEVVSEKAWMWRMMWVD